MGAHILVLAHKTAATPALIDAVRERARRGPCRFTLLVPRAYWDPDTEAAAAMIELAVPLLDEAAGSHVDASVGPEDPCEAVREALASEHFDEIILSTLPERVSHWLRRDLPRRVEALGLPVTVVTARQRDTAPTRAG